MMHRIIAYVLRDVNARPTYTLQQPGGEVTMVVELRQISCYFTKKFFVFEVSNEATGEFYATVEVFVCLYDYNDEHIGSNINQLQVSPPLACSREAAETLTLRAQPGYRRLIVSGKGSRGGDFASKIWSGGYNLVLRAVSRVLKECVRMKK